MNDPKPNILLTNDDGIHSPGIKHLWTALKDIAGTITVVAPSQEQSAVSLSITIRSPLRIEKAHWPEMLSAWSVTGTPADCVKLALSVLLDKKPDLIVSGINKGSNAGRNTFYSGTIAGVIEGLMHDIPGVAFSCCDHANPDFLSVEKHIPLIIKHVLEHPLPTGTLLNVNFPVLGKEIKGYKLARQGKEYWAEDPSRRIHPTENHSYFWLGARIARYEEHEDSDIALLDQGYITAVPVHVHEMTDLKYFMDRRDHFEKMLNVER